MALAVTATEDRTKPTATLDRLTALLEADLALVNTLILKRMQSPVALIPQLAGHIIAAGGKRLRPMLTLATSRMCGYRGERHIALAAAVEFIHTATLLHDDVVDASDLRRGLATANAVWGNKPSVLVGDFLFSRAFELMVDDGCLRVLDILATAAPNDSAYPNPQVEVGRFLYPVFVRGQAYLLMRRADEAIAEFQKMLNFPSLIVNCPLGPLAYLGLARAYTLQGDITKARAAYDEFFALWKDADQNIPVLKQAKLEYAKLQ